MSERELPIISAAAKEFNIGADTLIEFLIEKGFPKEELKPTSKLSEDMYRMAQMEFHGDKLPKAVTKVDLNSINSTTDLKKEVTQALTELNIETEKEKPSNELVDDVFAAGEQNIELEKLAGPKILGRIKLSIHTDTRPVEDSKRKRKRIPIEPKIKVRQLTPELSWKKTKDKYKIGNEFEFVLKAKTEPGVLIFSIAESVNGILHISDLNWNFGLCQLDYRQARIGTKMTVQVLSYDDHYRKIFLGRKYLKSIQKPSDSLPWKNLELNKQIIVTVFEELRKKIVVQTECGLFGTIPIISDRRYEIGSKIEVTPVRKLSDQNLLECVQKELTENVDKQIASAVSSFRQVSPKNNFLTSEKHLVSAADLENSIYWNYFTPDERYTLKYLFENTHNLFSRVDKSELAISFEFDFYSNIYEDFKYKIAPVVFDFDKVEISDSELLIQLGKMNFWYTQFETARKAIGTNQYIQERYFSLFNEKISIRGVVSDEGALKIRHIKSRINDGLLRENQLALKKNDVFYLNRPIIFSQYGNGNEENPKFIQAIENKTLAFKLYEIAKAKSLSILQQQGKDFRIFHQYLESQIDYESKENEKKEFVIKDCQLEPGIHVDGITVRAEALTSPNIGIGDKATISISDSKGKVISIGVGQLLNISGNSISIKTNIENIELLKDGAVLKKIISTKQHDVQINTLTKFLSNKLPLDTLYKVFHNKDLIEPPEEPNLSFFNLKLTQKEGPQYKAVQKAVGNKNLLLIQGPPGTGKTTVITEIVKQLVSRGKKVLVTSQTHIAVDNVLERICEDSTVHIARVGNLESISEIASGYLIEEGRKLFARKLQTNVDTKIDLVNLHLTGADLSIYNSNQFDAYKLDNWESYEQFIDFIRNSSREQNLKTISYLEHWKEVIVKSPVLLADIFLKNLDVVFGTCIGIATNKEFSESDIYFDTVILDEAGKANISETLTAISRAKRIILVGDHKQLPPFLDSERVSFFQQFAKETEEHKPTEEQLKKALGASFFEYLQKDGALPPENKILLDEQHRMHPDIANFISLAFYNSSLRNADGTENNVILLPEPFDRQMVFVDTSSDRRSFETFRDDSYFNQVEAEFIVKRILPEFEKNNLSPESCAILSPYTGQCEKIRELLKNSNNEFVNSIEIATLDSFQGREYEIIIFSFTRSSLERKVGFLDDARRLNVALSRAKKKLILVGNAMTLQNPSSHFDKYYCNLFRNLWKYAGRFGYAYTPNNLDFRRLQTTFNLNEVKKGKIRRIYDSGVLVSLGVKEGFIPKSFFKINFKEKLNEGQEVDVEILWISSDGKITLTLTIEQDYLFPKNKLRFICFKAHHTLKEITEGKISKTEPVGNGRHRVIVELPCRAIGVAYSSDKNSKLAVGNVIKFKVHGSSDDRLLINGEILL